jgi:hypothetical protein
MRVVWLLVVIVEPKGFEIWLFYLMYISTLAGNFDTCLSNNYFIYFEHFHFDKWKSCPKIQYFSSIKCCSLNFFIFFLINIFENNIISIEAAKVLW